MPEIEINIELYCARCGGDMCALGTATSRRGQPCFQITPCETCLEQAERDADEAGYARGYEAGEAHQAGRSSQDVNHYQP